MQNIMGVRIIMYVLLLSWNIANNEIRLEQY